MAEPTLFTRIIAGEIPAEFLYQDELCVVIRDIKPQAPVHALIIPRKPLSGIQVTQDEDRELLGHLFLVARQIARDEGIADKGYRLVINAGEGGGQEVPHLHIHLLGGRQMLWPPG
ncbi:MAG TPA: histidine triad nucleotide-binding protein [Candidatus Krumholzibacteria bacterium]|nr:histidine triad nucleotide-binding protein [Candidatus Krumholzibacteria bacterium]